MDAPAPAPEAAFSVVRRVGADHQFSALLATMPAASESLTAWWRRHKNQKVLSLCASSFISTKHKLRAHAQFAEILPLESRLTFTDFPSLDAVPRQIP
jgi:hypothetical protein